MDRILGELHQSFVNPVYLVPLPADYRVQSIRYDTDVFLVQFSTRMLSYVFALIINEIALVR